MQTANKNHAKNLAVLDIQAKVNHIFEFQKTTISKINPTPPPKMSLPPLSDDECLFLSNDGFKRLAQCWDPKIPLKNYEWTTDYTLELPIKLKKSGPGTIIFLFYFILIF